MAPPKTAAQVQADADAAREQDADAQREEQQRRQAGMFDWIKGLIPNFSFMGMLEMALIVTGIYFFAKTDMGQKLISGITDHLSPDMQGNILGFLNRIGIDIDVGKALEAMDHDTLHAKLANNASPEVLDIIDPNDGNKTLHEFLDVIRGANGGKVTMKGFTSPETITALIKQKPDMARALVIAAMKPTADGKPSDTATQMNASIKTLIAGPMLDDLLSPANRAGTLKVLTAALPAGTPVSEQSLADMIAKGLDANGKPTDALRKLFSDAVDGNKDAVVSGAYTMVGPAGFVDLIDASKMTSEAAKYAVLAVQQKDSKANAAFVALATAIGNDKAQEFLTTLQSPDAGNLVPQLLLTKENVHALPQAVALLDQLPDLASKLPLDQAAALKQAREFLTPAHIPAIVNIVNNGIKPLVLASDFMVNGQFSMDHAVDVLLQPVVRANLKQAGTANIAVLMADKNAFLSQRNLDAIIRFGDTLDGNSAGTANTRVVMHALAKVATGTPMADAFKGLSGAQLATFFSVPANRAAFKALLDPKTGIVGSTPAMQQELALLAKDFDKGNGVGLGAILSDEKSAQFLLDHDDCKGGNAAPEFVERGVMWSSGGEALKNGANQDILLELGRTLNNSTTNKPASAPAKNTNLPAGWAASL